MSIIFFADMHNIQVEGEEVETAISVDSLQQVIVMTSDLVEEEQVQYAKMYIHSEL